MYRKVIFLTKFWQLPKDLWEEDREPTAVSSFSSWRCREMAILTMAQTSTTPEAGALCTTPTSALNQTILWIRYQGPKQFRKPSELEKIIHG